MEAQELEIHLVHLLPSTVVLLNFSGFWEGFKTNPSLSFLIGKLREAFIRKNRKYIGDLPIRGGGVPHYQSILIVATFKYHAIGTKKLSSD